MHIWNRHTEYPNCYIIAAYSYGIIAVHVERGQLVTQTKWISLLASNAARCSNWTDSTACGAQLCRHIIFDASSFLNSFDWMHVRTVTQYLSVRIYGGTIF